MKFVNALETILGGAIIIAFSLPLITQIFSPIAMDIKVASNSVFSNLVPMFRIVVFVVIALIILKIYKGR